MNIHKKILDDLEFFKTEFTCFINEQQKINKLPQFSDKKAEEVTEQFLKNNHLDPKYNSGSTKFPDMIIDCKSYKIGIEVKTNQKKSKTQKKITLGNSSTQAEIKVKKIITVWFIESWDNFSVYDYKDLVKTLVVDHNPRFQLSSDINDRDRPFLLFLKNNRISFYDFLALESKEKNKWVKQFLKQENSIQTWRWFMGENDEFGLENMIDMLSRSCQEWKRFDKTRAITFLFAKHIELFKATQLDQTTLWIPLYKEFGVFGAIKDEFTGGGKVNGFPQIIDVFLKNLKEIINIVPKAKRSDWSNQVKTLFIKPKIIGPKDSKNKRNGITNEQAEKIYEEIDKLITS